MADSPGDAERREQDEHAEEERRFEDRWKRDHSSDIPRTSSGGLPVGVLIIAIIFFAVGFYLFRRWRSQYVDYSNMNGWGEQLPALMAGLGLS